MSAYIKGLTEAVEADEAEHHRRRAEASEQSKERLSPLEDRLKRLLTTISVDVQREGLSICSLQQSLRGRWRGNCHPGELGAALRKLGFTRRRRWRGDGAFEALWYPRTPAPFD